MTKPHLNEDYIRGWRREIEIQKATIARLTRRLKREWGEMRTQAPPTLETIEGLVDEVHEWHARVHRTRQKLARRKRGSEAYLELLPDLLVELDVLKRKAEYAAELLEAFEESLPED